ncbi:MAG TPA: TIGR02996 domain-containing protein [Gemmataceae bacterium]|nr:TIGR02996 domain-containing protein [Gemmataceae bacterium]
MRAVCESPDDDAPRLVYADWLEEGGAPEHAEFIRSSVRVARGDLNGDDRADAVAGIEALTPEWLAWSDTLPRPPGVQWHRWNDRGFVSAVEFDSPAAFAAHAATIFASAPISRLILSGFDPRSVGALTDSPLLTRIRQLEFLYSRLADAGVERLAGCAHLSQLRHLNLSANDVGDTGLNALTASPHLTALEVLVLSQNRITSTGALWLTDAHAFPLLDRLFVNGNPINPQVLAVLRERVRRVEA